MNAGQPRRAWQQQPPPEPEGERKGLTFPRPSLFAKRRGGAQTLASTSIVAAPRGVCLSRSRPCRDARRWPLRSGPAPAGSLRRTRPSTRDRSLMPSLAAPCRARSRMRPPGASRDLSSTPPALPRPHFRARCLRTTSRRISQALGASAISLLLSEPWWMSSSRKGCRLF